MLSKRIVSQLFNPNRQLNRLRQSHYHCTTVQKYLNTPLPEPSAPIKSVKFVALDFETTGLNYFSDKLLSFGTVELSVDQIDLASSTEILLRNENHVRPESAVVNGILPQHIIEQGVEEHIALQALLDKLAGKAVLSHNAEIEQTFLQKSIEKHYGIAKLPFLFVDTLKIEKQFSYLSKSKLQSSLQLNDLRDHYQLPGYYAHSAASDALACAELFLAQLSRFRLQTCKLKKLLV